MKKFLKRFTGCILIVALCAGFGFNIYAKDTEQVVSEEYYEAMEVLRLISVIPNYYDYNTDFSEKVTRADFVSAAAKLIKLTEYSGLPYYYDVPGTHWAYKEVSALTQCGILNGHGSKLFRPDDVITKNEALKVTMTILGYGDWAEYNGGYPAGYIKAANRAEILNGVSDNAEISLGDMFMILYNAIKVNILEPVSFGTESTSYDPNGTDTLLTIYHDIYYADGVVNGADCVTLKGAELSGGEVMIDEFVFTTDLLLGDYLGETIEFFYHADEKNDVYKILWAKKMYGDKDVLTIDVDNDASFNSDSYTLTYFDEQGNRSREVNIPRGIKVIYNGGAVNDNISTIFNMPRYSLKLVKNSGGEYFAAVVKAYENYVVNGINSVNRVIYDKIVSGRELNLNENDYTRLFISINGNELAFGDITENQVLTVYRSLDNKYAEVYLSGDIVTGVVDRVSDSDSGKLILMDGVEYYLPNSTGISISSGDSVKLYLDYHGEIAYSSAELSAYTPAYLIKASQLSGVFNTSFKLHMLNKQGAVVDAQTAEKIKIDGKSYTDMGKALDCLCPDGEFKPQLVMIRTNKDGNITMIDTVTDNPDTEEDDNLVVSVPEQSAVVFYGSSLGHKAVLDSNSVIFSIPAKAKFADAEDKSFTVLKNLTNWKKYATAETYKIQDRIGYEQFVLVSGNDASAYSYTDIPVLVDSFADGLNDDGEIVENLIAYQGEAQKTFVLDEDYSLKAAGVERGDIIRLQVRPDGIIDGYTPLVDYSDISKSTVLSGYNTQIGFSFGYVYDVMDDVVKFGRTIGDYEASIYSADVPCVVFDTAMKDNNIYAGTISDARTYINSKDLCSMVFVVQMYSIPKFFVIYN